MLTASFNNLRHLYNDRENGLPEVIPWSPYVGFSTHLHAQINACKVFSVLREAPFLFINYSIYHSYASEAHQQYGKFIFHFS